MLKFAFYTAVVLVAFGLTPAPFAAAEDPEIWYCAPGASFPNSADCGDCVGYDLQDGTRFWLLGNHEGVDPQACASASIGGVGASTGDVTVCLPYNLGPVLCATAIAVAIVTCGKDAGLSLIHI